MRATCSANLILLNLITLTVSFAYRCTGPSAVEMDVSGPVCSCPKLRIIEHHTRYPATFKENAYS